MSIKSFRFISLFVMAICVSVCPLAEASSPLAGKVPAGAVAYCGDAGWNSDFEKSHTGLLLKELPVDEILATFEDYLAMEADLGPDAKKVVFMGRKLLLEKPMAIYVRRFDIHAETVEGGMLIELGDDLDELSANVNWLLDQAATELDVSDKTIGGAKCRTVVLSEGMGLTASIYKGYLLLTIGTEDIISELIDVINGDGAALTADADFNKAMATLSCDKMQTATYMDIPAAMELLKAAADWEGDLEGFTQFCGAMGLDKISSVVSCSQFEGKSSRSYLRIVSAASDTGVLKMLDSAASPNIDCSDLPADAKVMVVANVDIPVILQQLRSILGKVSPQNSQQMDMMFQMASAQLGVQLEQDLIGSLGSRVTMSYADSLGGFGGLVITIDIRDMEKFNTARTRLEDFLKGIAAFSGDFAIKTATAGDVDITSLYVTAGALPISPSWCVDDGKLVISAWPQPVMTYTGGDIKLDLQHNSTYAAMLKSLTVEPSTVIYSEPSSSITDSYHGLLFMNSIIVNSLQKNGFDVSATWLMDLPRLLKYCPAEIMAVSSDTNGLVIESISGHECISCSIVSKGLFTAMLVAPLSQQRGAYQSSRMRSADNLRQLFQMYIYYMQLQRDKCPATMEILLQDTEDMYENIDVISPVTGNKYVYVPVPMMLPDLVSPHELIVFYDPPRPDDKTVLAMFGDGHYETLSREYFDEVLKASLEVVDPEQMHTPTVDELKSRPKRPAKDSF